MVIKHGDIDSINEKYCFVKPYSVPKKNDEPKLFISVYIFNIEN